MTKSKKIKLAKRISIVVVIFTIVFWIVLEPIILHRINKELNSIEGYRGSLKDVDVYLLTGSVTLDSLLLELDHGAYTKPIVDLPETNISLQWSSLFRGRIVGELELVNPKFNLEIEPNTEEVNFDEDINWVEILKEIGIIEMNRVDVRNGEINYYDYSSGEKVHLYGRNIDMTGINLVTVYDKTEALPSSISLTGNSIGRGKLKLDVLGNFIREVPDIDLTMEFTEINLPDFNAAFQKYSKFDLEEGYLNFYTEVAVKDSIMSGYFKPLFKDLKVIDWEKREKKPRRAAWEAMVGLFAKSIENNKEDQIGTKVEVSGNLKDLDANISKSIWILFKNAYIQPLKEQIDKTISLESIEPDK